MRSQPLPMSELPDKELLEALCNQYDPCKLECDGMTRVISTVLTRNGIPFTSFLGAITYLPTLTAFAPHFWITVGEWIIDYRARMWLGNLPEVPHGIFVLKDYHEIEYEGIEYPLEALNDVMFQFLTEGANI